MPMQEIGLPTFFFMLLVRVAAAIDISISVFGILWFADFYFDEKNFLDLASASIPSMCLFVGAFTFERWFRNEFYYWAYLVLLAVGILFIVTEMVSDLSLPNGPDYSAFQIRIFSLGLFLIFALRAFFVRRATITGQARNKKEPR